MLKTKKRNKMDQYVIGVSGHRDLDEKLLTTYRDAISTILKEAILNHPDREVIVLSALADGADRLAVEAAVALGLRYEVLLPMREALYLKDFSYQSKLEFKRLCFQASKCKIINLFENNTDESIDEYGESRNLQYREVGREMVRCTDEMIFLFDGVINNKTGGTADIWLYAEQLDRAPRRLIAVKRTSRE